MRKRNVYFIMPQNAHTWVRVSAKTVKEIQALVPEDKIQIQTDEIKPHLFTHFIEIRP